jgi:hypothetical protein
MPDEVIARVNTLDKADQQIKVLTFYDRKGRLIGESQTPGVSDEINVDTTIPNNNDGYGDLNPPTVNQDYGLDDNALDEVNNINQPTQNRIRTRTRTTTTRNNI